MEAQILLRDPEVFPSNEVLRGALGKSAYSALESFFETLASHEYGLIVEWRFYNDGKMWLGKIEHKKKTALWLSVWSNCFKATFYFTQKHLEAITSLDISETIKDEFSKAKHIGRLIPMIIEVSEKDQLKDLLTVVRFKKNLK